jgi:hypothetical protein
MSIFNVDLYIDHGTDFSFTTCPWVVNNEVQDLTDATCRCVFYKNADDISSFFELKAITTNGTAGTVTVPIPQSDVAYLPADQGPLQYDLFLDKSTTVLLQHGQVFMNSTFWGA